VVVVGTPSDTVPSGTGPVVGTPSMVSMLLLRIVLRVRTSPPWMPKLL
jgi:hypothetical protein